MIKLHLKVDLIEINRLCLLRKRKVNESLKVYAANDFKKENNPGEVIQ